MGALIINVTRRGFALRKCAQSPAIAAQKSIRARAQNMRTRDGA
jgi:hypothetical protein